MSSKDEIASMIRDCYAARQRNDADGALAFFHPDIRFRIAGSTSLKPLTDTVAGLGALRPAMVRLVIDWDWSQFPIADLIVDGPTAVVHSAGRMKHVPSGIAVHTETLDKLTLRDGKIIEFVEFADTHAIAQMLSLSAD